MSHSGNGDSRHRYAQQNAARLIGKAVVKLQLTPTISIEVSEPDPNKIHPGEKAGMQAFVGSLHAISQHRENLELHFNMIAQLDQVVQGLAHMVDYLARRVAMLEERSVMPLPADEHAETIGVHRTNIGSLTTSLRARLAEQQSEKREDG